jgi:hypothetical protein
MRGVAMRIVHSHSAFSEDQLEKANTNAKLSMPTAIVFLRHLHVILPVTSVSAVLRPLIFGDRNLVIS